MEPNSKQKKKKIVFFLLDLAGRVTDPASFREWWWQRHT